MPVDPPGGGGRARRRRGKVDELDVAAGVQRVRVERDALHGQLREGVQELLEPAPPGVVERDGHVRAAAQDAADQVREHAARPGLDEDADAVGGHRLDLGREPDG